MDTIIDYLERNSLNANANWHFPAENKTLSLSKLSSLSTHYAMSLLNLGVKPGDRVGLLLNTSSDYVSLLLAIWRLNAVAVPLRPNGSKQTRYSQYIQYCDEVCDFKGFIYGTQSNENLFETSLNDKEKFAVPLTHFQQLSFDSVNASFTEYKKSNPEDIAILQFSSGSTGNPKAVMVTHGMMMAQLQNILYNHIGSRRGWPIESLASWMPINHDMGLFIGVLTPVYTACTNLLAPTGYYMRNPSRWFQLLSDHNVDMTFSTNSVLASTLPLLRRLQKSESIDLSNLHLYIGAEKVSPIVVRRCYETLEPLKLKKQHIHIGYGMAENALGAACTRSDLITQKHFKFTGHNQLQEVTQNNANTFEVVALGTPDRFHEISIRDEQDHILPDLMLGEINIQSPCVTPGYYNNQPLSEEKVINSRLRTGDLGFYYQGELYFYARKDDMIVAGGRNIIPDDIEGIAEELPFVRPTTSCLIGLENIKTGAPEISLLVEVKDNVEETSLREYRNRIQAHVFENLDVMISRILFCVKGTIEKTSSGKKRRKVVQQRFLNGEVVLAEAQNG